MSNSDYENVFARALHEMERSSPVMLDGMKVGESSVLVKCGKDGECLMPQHKDTLREDYGKPDIDRAKREGTLRGDPMIAPAWSNYPEGHIVDYFCLACGSTFAAHDDDSSCWRVLKTDEELARYDAATDICNEIRYGQ